MSDEMSFAEIGEQHMELLPARTVMSMFTTGPAGGGTDGGTGESTSSDSSTPAANGLVAMVAKMLPFTKGL